jgi:YVTN family beta-propeller protein
MKNLIYFIALFITVTFYSCNENNPVTAVISTSEGVFVLNEGGMNPGSSKLSYYNSVKDSFYVNVFNPTTLGLFPDGMIKYNSNLYITEQGNYNAPGKIYKTDMNGTVISQSSIGTNPYSLCAANNKLYITNGPASTVSVADLNSLNTIKNISVGVYPQEIISYNNTVFVCNTGTFGGASDSTISVIDANSDDVIKTLTVDKNPSSLAITNSKKLIAASNSTNGKIYVFETVTYTLVDSLYSPYGFSKDFSVDRNTDNVYFIGYDGDIIKLDFRTKTFSSVIGKPSNAFIYGYVFDYINGKHYLADAVNFTSAGNLKIYSENGSYIKDFQTGIAPRRILINKQ